MATTRSTLNTRVRERARIGTNVADTTVDRYLDRAAINFQHDTLLLRKYSALTVRGKFTMLTSEAFKLTISTSGGGALIDGVDIVPSSNQVDVAGSTLAADLESAIQATGASSTTCSFSESTRKFTINASGEAATVTSIAVTYPAALATYTDASYKLFGTTTSASSDSFSGSPAPYCTSEYHLPSDFIEMDEVVYDENWDDPLQPEIYRGRSDSKSGTPKHYSIYMLETPETDDVASWYIRFTPQPIVYGKRFDYCYHPEARTISSGSAGDAQYFDFPARWDEALIYYACYLAKIDADEMQDALNFLGLYRQEVNKAIVHRDTAVGGAFDMMDRGRQGL
jgi:hypothetical protein